MSKDFAYITHPENLEQLKKTWPLAQALPGFLAAFLANAGFPLKVTPMQGVRSLNGKTIQGDIIICPILPGNFFGRQDSFLSKKIVEAVHIAENSGAGILGLGGYISGAANRSPAIARSIKISFTTGTALSAWSLFEALYRTAKSRKIDFQNSTLAVIGAGCPIGSLCARKFSSLLHKIILYDIRREKAEALKNKILASNQLEVIVGEDVHKTAGMADLTLIVGCRPRERILASDFKPNSVICDTALSSSAKHAFSLRPDLVRIDGGLIKTPNKDIVQAALAETMLLTFEERFVNYSLEEDTNIEKLDEIADIAARHGFEVWLPET